ncbi:hypothetical protein PC118_g20723 [Phytophthora cactorum]|uniref:Peptidase S74 domain-containing protein n=2 Tax=Phytophthora cactorum TaxID=29920 RepID=A0A8T1F8Z1_9STRA|nr:hypothetical protein PC118_g20723 [Phytophthora cactorum]
MYLGITQGSATTQKALVVNSTLNISGIRNFVCTGTSTLGTVNCGSITTSSTNTISTYGISVGSGGITGTLQTGSQTNITAVGTLDSLAVGSYGLHVRNDSNGLSTYNGIAFLNDTTTVFGTTTPSTSISCVRRSATTYDGADIEFCVGANNGSCDLNILKNAAGASLRIGGYESTSNCFTITFTYVSSCSMSNHLEFNNWGVSGNLTLFGNNNVATGTTSLPPSKFQIVRNTTNAYGSWDRVSRYTNDQATPMAIEILVYNEAGGSANNTAGGATIDTMTNDPFKVMVNGSNVALFNTSGRFMVVGNFQLEATINSSGEVWCNGGFYNKANSSSQASYRGNWSSANYWGIGSDATVGAIHVGITDASYNWTAYVPLRGGAYTNASDARLKRDIVDIPYGLSEVLRMRPRRFITIQDNAQHVGFIAQEMAPIIPECVSGEESVDDILNEDGCPVS